MSKCALEALEATLGREFLPLGIGVTVLQPGSIRTALLASAAISLSGDSAPPRYSKALNNAASVLGMEMKTGMEPDRVARVIVHCLESPHAPLPLQSGQRSTAGDSQPAACSHSGCRGQEVLVALA